MDVQQESHSGADTVGHTIPCKNVLMLQISILSVTGAQKLTLTSSTIMATKTQEDLVVMEYIVEGEGCQIFCLNCRAHWHCCT